MAQYRFTGTGVDISLFTDSPATHKEFFVTEVRGQDPAEIMAGYDFEIEQMHEGDLVDIAEDNSLTLYLNDLKTGQILVYMPTTIAFFNGLTSRLLFSQGSIDIADGDDMITPWEVSFDYLLTQDQWDLLPTGNPIYFVSFDVALTTAGSDFSIELIKERNGLPSLRTSWKDTRGATFRLVYNLTVDQIVGELHNIRFRYQLTPTFETILFIDGSEIERMESRESYAIKVTNVPVTVGAQRDTRNTPQYSNYIIGFIRNFIWSSNGVEIINVADLSTGANTGSGSDAVVTDVVSQTIR